ncbi:MAG TPA: hypothetical protein DCS67_06670, partial [Clostridiales bacterium UBA8960]|nr:hypothetical protein [Clostridiales bacterium UBA8960]
RMDAKRKKFEKLNQSDFDVFDRLIAMPTVILNEDGVIFVNKGFTEAFGYDTESINQIGVTSLFHRSYVRGFKSLIRNALNDKPFNEQGEVCFRTKEQGDYWVEHKSRVVQYNDKPYLLCQLLEINEKKHYQQHLKKLLQLREAMLEVTQSIVSSEGMGALYGVILKSVIGAMDHARLGTVLRREGDVMRPVAQIGFEAMSIENFKLPIKELFLYRAIGKKMDRIAKIDDLKIFGEYYKISTITGEDEYIRSTISAPIYIKGEFFGVVNVDSTQVNAFDDDDVKLMEFVRDNVEIAISNQLLYEEKAFLSRYDSLTSLYNRHYFDDVFENIRDRALRYNEKFNLVVFDLNNLKRTNDEFGHMIGDEVLRYFAESCKKLLRKSDIIARYGGDEFVAVIFNSNPEKLRKRLDEHLKMLNDNPMKIKTHSIVCTYSYGISSFGEDGYTLNELFRIADDKMYQNKIRHKLGFDFINAVEISNTPKYERF